MAEADSNTPLRQACNLPQLIMALQQHCDFKKMTDEELYELGGALDVTENLSQSLGDMLTGIGCLINDDDNAGNFQSKDDVPNLLFYISEQLITISALAHLGREIQFIREFRHGTHPLNRKIKDSVKLQEVAHA